MRNFLFNIISIFLICVISMMSCGKSDNSSDANVIEKSKIRIVNNSAAGKWGNSKTANFQKDLTIGVEEGEETKMFGYISEMELDDQSNIYVVDSYQTIIRKYSADGSYFLSFGGEGTGPGEFQSISGIHWYSFDNHLYISDSSNDRINKFTINGVFVKSFKTFNLKIRAESINSFANGDFVITGIKIGENNSGAVIIITDNQFTQIKKQIIEKFPVYSSNKQVVYPARFADVSVENGETLYYSYPSEYKIIGYNDKYEKSLIFKKSFPKFFIPQYHRGFYSDFGEVKLKKWQNFYLANVQYADVDDIPRFKDKREMIKFIDGNLTGEANKNALKYKGQLDVFDSNLDFLLSVPLQAGAELLKIDKEGRLYFREKDSFHKLVRYKLKIEDV